MSGRVGRGVGVATLLAAIAFFGLLLSGALVALAETTALLVGSGYQTSSWTPASMNPSGAAWIDSGGFLFVVDTNVNNPSGNGWEFDIHTGAATGRGTGVEEPTGVDYDPDTNTLFISQDDGHIFVFTDFDTSSEQSITLTVTAWSFDTEDPVYNRANGRLYWVDGVEDSLFELEPVNGWGGGDDIVTGFSLDGLAQDADWEGLAWDPRTGNLLIGNGDTNNELIYETNTSAGLINTVNATGVQGLTKISGMGVSPASYDATELSLWVTDRNSSGLFELSFDGTVPPSTTTTTAQGTTSTTGQGSTTTTTEATTTTTQPGATTTTTEPDPGVDSEDPFVDDDGNVFESAIEWLAAEGITQGCNPPLNDRFCPDDDVTRGEMAAFLVRALDYTDDRGGDWFIDDDGSVFESAIDKLAAAGVTKGCNPPDNTRFCPDENVTRGEMAAFLKRALGN